jgi:lipopolysaccharide transport system ATP-binding protein
MSEPVISVENLGKQFFLGETVSLEKTISRIKHGTKRLAARPFGRVIPPLEQESVWAVRNLSFEVPKGKILGIVGKNGSGKSTTLKILSRITKPSEGRALIHGEVSSMLEVGTGFNAELTGRHNVYLNAAILGFSQKEIHQKFDDIVEFSGIGHYIDTPIKRYSSGMSVRLAFAVGAHLDTEVMIIDEVLSVGDIAFQKKCLERVKRIKDSGRTVIFVSHNSDSMRDLCDDCIWMEKGHKIMEDTSDKVMDAYLKKLSEDNNA